MVEPEINAVEIALGKPVLAEMPENALKVRRNLLISGLFSVFIALGEIKLNASSPILGFTFTGISDVLVRNALLVVDGYLLFHFLWYSFDSLLEWRIRITGTRLAFVTGSRFGSEHCDYPDDPRQSTLYRWWLDQAKRIGNFNKTAEDISKSVQDWCERVEAFKSEGDSLDFSNAMNSLNQVKISLDKLKEQIETTEKIIDAKRIPCSLKRFDSWFSLFLRSQNLRWLLIDVLTPLFVGGLAICLLVVSG